MQYPEDRSLLGRKALKAAKEIATKQSADQPPDEMALKRDVIVPIEKTAGEEPLPKLIKVVEEAIQKEKAEVESENVEEDWEDIETLEASSTPGQQSREESSD